MKKYKYESYDYSKVGINKYYKTIWHSDVLSYIQAYNNIDAERELTAVLSEKIAIEIDRNILANLSNYTGPINVPTYVNNRVEFLNIYNNG